MKEHLSSPAGLQERPRAEVLAAQLWDPKIVPRHSFKTFRDLGHLATSFKPRGRPCTCQCSCSSHGSRERTGLPTRCLGEAGHHSLHRCGVDNLGRLHDVLCAARTIRLCALTCNSGRGPLFLPNNSMCKKAQT